MGNLKIFTTLPEHSEKIKRGKQHETDTKGNHRITWF
jgi:hypothetical protein